MDVHAIKAAWDHYLLIGSGVAYAGVSLLAAGYMLVCAYRGMCGMAKRIGWASVAVLLSFFVWATITGTPTQEDKEDAIEQEQGEAQTNAMFGAMWFGGGLRANVGGSGFGIGAGNSSEPEGAGDQLSDFSSFAFPDPVVENESAPMVRSLTGSDYTAGFALSRIGTGETFDFSAPQGSTVCEDWLAFGASRDWFRLGNGERGMGNVEWGFAFPFGTNTVDALTVFSNGSLRPRMKCRDNLISPFETTLCVVPSENWHLLSTNSAFCMPNSQFWHYHTPTNTLVMTWQNVLLDQLVEKPVSFQTEFFENGDIAFRYDLSHLADTTVSDLVVGIRNVGYGRVFTQLDRNVTSLYWHRLDPLRASESDPDDDGITTDDEVLVYHTDPYSADSDRDGLSDGREIGETHTDPLDAHTLRADMPDGMASVIGDLDPFSCPDGSTNTVWEHVFYTGTTNAPFAYPSPSGSTAVLEVTVSGIGSGELIVGDKVVPLLVRGGSAAPKLYVDVPVGRRVPLSLRGDSAALSVDVDSCSFAFGELPSGSRRYGWIVFPRTEATHPCVHDGSDAVEVSLDPGTDAGVTEGLSCTWSSRTDDVSVYRLTPLSAELTFRFPRMSVSEVSYVLSHPKRLFGETTFVQTCEFCPKFEEEEEDAGLYWDEDGDGVLTWCQEHGCLFRDCWFRHGGQADDPVSAGVETNFYHTATNSPNQLAGVLKLHRPYYENDADEVEVVRVEVPPEGVHCCQCEEHWVGQTTLGFKSCRLDVLKDGETFRRTTEDCDLMVCGAGPSEEFGDASLSLLTNGIPYVTRDYTVFGVSVTGYGWDLRRFNELDPGFGMPFVVNTNLDNAAIIGLCTDVNLPDGVVRLAFEDAKARMQLWMTFAAGDYAGHEAKVLVLDSETRPEIELPIADWKRLVRSATSGRETRMKLLAYGCGSARLFFGYAGCDGGRYFHDETSQTFTAVRPPLLPDYNRDGRIDDADAFDYSNGRVKYFWANQDTWSGDDAFEPYDHGFHPAPYSLPCNGEDLIVNGRNDLVNLCPLAVDLSRQFSAWGDRVRYELVTGSPGKMRFVPVEAAWDGISKIVSEDRRVVGSDAMLHEATLFRTTASDRGGELPYVIPDDLAGLGVSSSGVFAVEFTEPRDYRPILRIREKNSDEVLFECSLNMRILDVHDMYRWVNLVDSWDWFDWHESHVTSLEVSWPDSEHADANVVFVHGYNVAEREAWDWSQAMFKRFWWMGVDAGFTAVRWRGDESQIWLGKMTSDPESPLPTSNGFVTKNFYQNVFNAFRTAGAFSTAVNALPGSRKYMVAHSLGNMLVCAARQFHGLEYEKYIMLNAAVPMEACDTGPEVFEQGKDSMTPREWVGYPDWSKASHWYDLFPEGDSRRGLTWRGLFKDVDNTVNFYSTKDEVLMNGDGKDKPVRRSYVWYLQETKKGMPLADFVSEAGWEFGRNYLHATETHSGSGDPRTGGGPSYTYVPWSAAEVVAGLMPDDMKSEPLFKGFDKWCITWDDGLLFDGGDTYLREHEEERFHILARGIPAESFAIGANPVPKWAVKKQAEKEIQKRDAPNSENRNIDMAKVKDPKTEEVIERNWVHSYFIKKSLFDTGHVFNMISDIIGTTKGKANENETR